MYQKKVTLLLGFFVLLIAPLLSCATNGAAPSVPVISSAPTDEAGPRFVITATASPAFTPTTISPITIEPTTITPITIEPSTIVPRTITPITIQPTTIVPRTITPNQISPARDLTGTWRGSGVSYWIDGGTGARIARTTWEVTLVITQQADNTVNGTLTMVTVDQENLTAANIPTADYGPDPITDGFVSATTLDFDIDTWHWTFTFTTDLMSGQYTTTDPGTPCDPKAFTLTRQN